MHQHYILLPSANIDRISNSESLIYILLQYPLWINNNKKNLRNVNCKKYSYLNELSSKFHKTGISEAEASLNPSEKREQHLNINELSLITHAWQVKLGQFQEVLSAIKMH